MVKVFLKNGRVIEVPMAKHGEFKERRIEVVIPGSEELVIGAGRYDDDLAKFPRSEVVGFTVEDDQEAE